MRIGLDARMYRSAVAGIGRYSQNLIKNLLVIDDDDEFVLLMTSADAREIRNKKWDAGNAKIVLADVPHYSLAEQMSLPKILAKENLDLVHYLNFNHPVRYRGRFMVTIHDLTLLFYPETAKETNFIKQWAYRYTMKKACQNALKIIAVSKNTKKDIVREFGVSEDKIKVIYEAADDKIFNVTKEHTDRLQKEYHLTKPIILYVGQFRQHKNLEGLIRAFKIIKEKTPCQLVLVGKNEGLRVDKTGPEGDIVMPGFVSDEDLAVFYQMAEVFVLPSFYEGFGLPGLEAMRAGTAVCASKTSSLPEIYQDAALYFDPFDAKDIAGKIRLVLEDGRLRRDMIERGKRVARGYSWRKTAKETLALYKKISNDQLTQ